MYVVPRKRRALQELSLIQNLPTQVQGRDRQVDQRRCWQFDKYGNCGNINCPFLHDYQYGRIQINKTCKYWLNGSCKYSDDQCYYRHSLSDQSTPADTSRSNTVASTSKRSRSATVTSAATETETSAVTETYQVVPPKHPFFFRTPYLIDPTLSRLGSYLEKTDHFLRLGNAVTVNGYPCELEDAHRQIRAQIEVYTTETHGIIVTLCNENGEFHVRSPNEFDDLKMKGCYSISSAHSIALTKSGAGTGSGGIIGRAKEQIPRDQDPRDFMGVLSVLEETMEMLELKSNRKMKDAAMKTMRLLPWTKSFQPVPLEYVVNQLDECAYASSLPGDPKLLGDRLLNMGHASVHENVRLPLDHVNAGVANDLEDPEQVKTLFSWTTEISSIRNQVSSGVTTTGKRMSQKTRQMVEDMVHMNASFMQRFMIFDRMFRGIRQSTTVDEFVNAVSTNPIGDSLADLARRVQTALDEEEDADELVHTLHGMLRDEFMKWCKDGKKFYLVESEAAGDPHLLAEKTKKVLGDMTEESIRSGEKTVIITEYTLHNALKDCDKPTHEKYFGKDKRCGTIYCANGSEAALLFRISHKVRILVMGSMFVMNAPAKSIELRLKMCAEFLAIQKTLVQAKWLDSSALDKSYEELLAFGIQLVDPLNYSNDTSAAMWAIKNNSPADYYFGKTGKKGLQALINILKDWLEIEGIHAEVMASFAMHLGARSLEALFEVIGHDINCNNMAATLLKLKRKQSYRGGPHLSAEHKKSISEAGKGKTKTLTAEHRNNISEGLKKRGYNATPETKTQMHLTKKISTATNARDNSLKYKIFEFECKECKKKMKRDYKQIYHVFGVELFNNNAMSARCPCCGKLDKYLRTNTKWFTRLQEVTLDYLTQRREYIRTLKL